MVGRDGAVPASNRKSNVLKILPLSLMFAGFYGEKRKIFIILDLRHGLSPMF